MPKVKSAPKKKQTKPPVNKPAVKFLPPWETGKAGPQTGTFEEDPGEAYDFRYVHPRTQALRRLFVAEYVKDFNGAAAIMRLGYQVFEPRVVAGQWLREPYTQYILDKFIREAEDVALVTRGEILAGLKREANSYGLDSSGASRVSALGKLAKILGIEITKIEGEVKAVGGVMLVPLGGNPEEWEKNAAKSQSDLKANAKT